MHSYPNARNSDLVVSDTKNETLVYDLNNNKVYCLNDTCRKVWSLCDGTRSIEQIGLDIDKTGTPEYREQAVSMALKQLQDSGLLKPDGLVLKQTSRREMMRTLGVAGGMALPPITSLIAPKAANAQSVGGCNPTCGISEQCCNGTCIDQSAECCTPACSGDQTCCGGTCTSNVCCAGNICNAGETCEAGACCPSDQACRGICCPAGQTCAGFQCCPSDQACGSSCCPEGQSCDSSLRCCPSAQVCGGSCCPEGQRCFGGFCV